MSELNELKSLAEQFAANGIEKTQPITEEVVSTNQVEEEEFTINVATGNASSIEAGKVKESDISPLTSEEKDIYSIESDNKPSDSNDRNEIISRLIKENPSLSFEELNEKADEILNGGKPKEKEDTVDEDGVTKDYNIDMVVVNIDKANMDDISFSEEEQRKLAIAKSIKLVPVETQELKTLKVKKPSAKSKNKMFKTLDKSIARASVPIPVLGEFAQFKGAQTIALISNIVNEDDTLSESLQKKVSLLYECFSGGTVIDKMDGKGNTQMTINEFADIYPYPDINMGLYGIFTASSKSTGLLDLQCNSCKKKFKHEYNIKNFLRFDNIPDKWKERIDDILTNKGSAIEIKRLMEECQKTHRIVSNVTGNIYDVKVPSCSKAKEVFDKTEGGDTAVAYYSMIILYLENIFMIDPESDPDDPEFFQFGRNMDLEKSIEEKIAKKIALSDEESEYNPIEEIFELLQEIPEEDIDLITKYIAGMFIEPNFAIVCKCPRCGRELTVPLSIEKLVFLVAQARSTTVEPTNS